MAMPEMKPAVPENIFLVFDSVYYTDYNPDLASVSGDDLASYYSVFDS